MALRFQATIAQMGRECQLIGTTLKMRVGVEGRLILGPAGGSGQVEVPLRFAVVQEGPEPKTITTKLQWVTVTIPPDQPNVSFTQIENELTFPMPLHPSELDAYVVYVGFDSGAVKSPRPPARNPPPPKPRRSG